MDISFSNENFLDLNELAIKRGVTAIVDAGLAPGIPNFLLGYHDLADFLSVIGKIRIILG